MLKLLSLRLMNFFYTLEICLCLNIDIKHMYIIVYRINCYSCRN